MDYLAIDHEWSASQYSPESYFCHGVTAYQRINRRARGDAGIAKRAKRFAGLRDIKVVVAKRPEPQKVAKPEVNVATEFKKLAREWRSATLFMSSPSEMAVHPAYQRIIALGAPALPLVIQELRSKGGHWFWALRFLANFDPVPQELWGNVPEMTRCWLEWWDANQQQG